MPTVGWPAKGSRAAACCGSSSRPGSALIRPSAALAAFQAYWVFTSSCTDTTKPEIDAPRKLSMAPRSVTKCELTRPAPTVSNSNSAIRESRASMRTRMRYTTSFASKEKVRPSQTLRRIETSRSPTVSNSAGR
jgi:hypothetical protein